MRQSKSISLRVASSADHSTSSIWLRARVTLAIESSITCSGVMFNLTRMCSGEVAITVWTRPRLANFTASAQRSMSFGLARERPAMTEFLERRAISLTAWKSPSEVIGKPASMTSTPMSSSISAISIFSSNVMVAPGHCSPSRRVVSNTMTRSFSDFGAVVIGSIPYGSCAAFSSAEGSGDLAQPLSAQAQAPRRPSGADKKQAAKKEGGQGRSRNRLGADGDGRSTLNSNHFAANQHCQTLEETESSAKTVDGSLPERRSGAVLDEKCGRPQCQKMVRKGDLTGMEAAEGQPRASVIPDTVA